MELLLVPFTGPVIPATILVSLVVGWSLLSIFGAMSADGWLDTDLLDLDGGVEGQVTAGLIPSVIRAGVGGWGLSVARWLNMSAVPIVVWGAVFAVAWWAISGFLWIAVDQFLFAPNWWWSTILAIKNLILALLLTKLLVMPLRTNFKQPPATPRSLIGRECTISSSEATPEFGLVRFQTGGAPLQLNVRTDGACLPRGTAVWITHYDAQRRVYIVSPTSTRTIDSANP
ncbi:MAG: hypothetical protein KF752_10815 [Pirellulaceae bacterium]|nr:hypothetical protein [Pirellulaceae bacterium]